MLRAEGQPDFRIEDSEEYRAQWILTGRRRLRVRDIADGLHCDPPSIRVNYERHVSVSAV